MAKLEIQHIIFKKSWRDKTLFKSSLYYKQAYI